MGLNDDAVFGAQRSQWIKLLRCERTTMCYNFFEEGDCWVEFTWLWCNGFSDSTKKKREKGIMVRVGPKLKGEWTWQSCMHFCLLGAALFEWHQIARKNCWQDGNFTWVGLQVAIACLSIKSSLTSFEIHRQTSTRKVFFLFRIPRRDVDTSKCLIFVLF